MTKTTIETVGCTRMIYIKVLPTGVEQTIEEVASVNTDRDADGNIVGIEIIFTPQELNR